MDWQSNLQSISFDWFILFLRVVFIVLIFAFLYNIARIMMRELVTIGGAVPSSSGSAGAPAITASLEVLEPGSTSLLAGESLGLNRSNTIGRNASNTLQISDEYVSGNHAELIWNDGVWWLIDSGSRNGTLVNNRRLARTARAKLAQGDVIQFGEVTFRFRM